VESVRLALLLCDTEGDEEDREDDELDEED